MGVKEQLETHGYCNPGNNETTEIIINHFTHFVKGIPLMLWQYLCRSQEMAGRRIRDRCTIL